MKTIVTLMAALLAAQAGGQARRARAELKDVQGRTVAEAVLEQRAEGVLVRLDAAGIPEGAHGLHFHETGRCEPDFEAAGAHYNPGDKEHGLRNPEGPHAGDLPDLFVPRSGTARYERLAAGVLLDALLEGDGAALMVHAEADDGRSDPAGGSGARIACGVLVRE